MSSDSSPPARPIFRKLAIVIAILSFLLAAAFGIFQSEDGWFPPVICLFVGFMMSVIGATGYWPPRRK